MINYAGEFGSIVEPLVFVGRPDDSTGMAEISLMLTRMFGSWLPMKWLDINDSNTAKIVRKNLNENKTLIFAEMPWHNLELQDVIVQSNSGNLVGIFLWDSTEIPCLFAQILNKFKKVLVPTEFIKKTMIYSGVETHIETLPLALDLRRFQLSTHERSQKVGRKPYKFGVISSQHPRKNLDLIVSAFIKLWQEGQEFDLVISSFLEQGAMLSETISLVPNEFKKNLSVDLNRKSIRELDKLFVDLDVLVSASSGEGFNIPVRQALASGMPVVISDIPGHEDLLNLPGVTRIQSSGEIPALYSEFGNSFFGSQRLITENSIIESIRLRLNIPLEAPYEISNSSKKWDYRNLEDIYRKAIFGGSTSAVSKQQPGLKVIAHDAGFFAIFNTFVSIRNKWQGIHGFRYVLPDWDPTNMISFWKTSDFTSFCYGKPNDGNLFYRLFDSRELVNEEFECVQNETSILTAHSFNASADPNLTFVNADKLYRTEGFPIWRKSMHETLGDLTPNQSIQKRLNETFRDLDQDEYVIGMHVRHPSHGMEQPDQQVALAEDYIRIAHQLVEEQNILNPNRKCRVFLATDQEIVANLFKVAFRRDLLQIADVERVSAENSQEYERLSQDQKLKEGHQIQHLKASKIENWNLSLAEDVIADAWGLAKSDVLVHSVSNVATAVLFLNTKTESLPIYKGFDLRDTRRLVKLRQQTSII